MIVLKTDLTPKQTKMFLPFATLKSQDIYQWSSAWRPYVQHFVKREGKSEKEGKRKKKGTISKHIFHRNLWYTVLVYKIGVTQMVSCTYNAPPFKYSLIYQHRLYWSLIGWSAVTRKSLFFFQKVIWEPIILLLRIHTSSIVSNSTLSLKNELN